MNFSMIAAYDEERGIGKDNKIPWFIPEDLKYFQKITTNTVNENVKQNVIIMGRQTWESIDKKYKPLKKRLNIIISSNHIEDYDNNLVFKKLDNALKYLSNRNDVDKIFIVGGEKLYQEGMDHPKCKFIYITEIEGKHECDRYFPKIDENKYKEIYEGDKNKSSKTRKRYRFKIYQSINH